MSDSDPRRGLPLLEDLGAVKDAKVLVRLDLNVPLTEGPDGKNEVADDFRIKAALPTLHWLVDHGAEVTVATHLGRPKGVPDPRSDVAPVRAELEELVGGLRVLENLRWSLGETENEPGFVQELINGQDIYVNDAFGVCHRAHASVVGPPQFLPCAAGRLVEREVDELGYLLDNPARPFVVVVGGAKIADKLGLLRRLSEIADRILVGGGMAFTFMKALGKSVGDSLVDEARIDECRELLRQRDNLVLPLDFVGLASEHDDETRALGKSVPEGWRGLDVGPETAALFSSLVAEAGSVLWNGPMGVFEDPRFAAGTKAVAEAVAACQGHTVIGGGDSVSAVGKLGLTDQIDHVSTGGGASLELLEYGDLPGLRALREGKRR